MEWHEEREHGGCCGHEGDQVRRMVVRVGHGRHHGGTGCCGGGGWHDCCCGGHGGEAPPGFRRRYESREERAAKLEAYLAELRAEARAVEEQLAELRG